MALLRSGNDLDTVRADCLRVWHDVWLVSDILVLIIGVAANAVVLWLLLRERKSLSSSQVLGVNIVVMDLIFLFVTPVGLLFDTKVNPVINTTESVTSQKPPQDVAKHFFSMFNLLGCPLLLACMCIERYMAVSKPVLYLRMKNWEPRMAVSAIVWLLTLCFCLGAGLTTNIAIVLVPVSIINSWLFVIMLACLGGLVRALRQKSPAHATHRNQAHTESPLKRQAVGNVLAVVVPAVMSYLPILMMCPLLLYLISRNEKADNTMCTVIELALFFPRFGVLIGPLFYLAKAKQLFCLGGRGNKENE